MSLWASEFGRHFDDMTDLHDIADNLAPDALTVLLALARRMQQGQEEYGNLRLKEDPRNWRKEIREELLDALVYMACEEVQCEQRRKDNIAP